jgi:hypothetical protein
MFFWRKLRNGMRRYALRGSSVYQIFEFREDKKPIDRISIDARIVPAKERLFFMGVSAKVLWGTKLETLMKGPRYRDCSFRFLLMDPQGEALARRMKWEGYDDRDGAVHDIESFRQQLIGIRADSPKTRVTLKYYDLCPFFWLVICDDTIYVQTFTPGKPGRESMLLVLKENGDPGSIYSAVLNTFEETWMFHAKTVSLEPRDSTKEKSE